MKDFVLKNKEMGDNEVSATYDAIQNKKHPKTQVSIMGMKAVQSYELEQMQVLAKLVDCKRVLKSRLANTNNPEEKKSSSSRNNGCRSGCDRFTRCEGEAGCA